MHTELYKEMAELEETHWWFRGRRTIITDMLERYVPAGARVLDVGLGTGANALTMTRLGYAVTGVEPSQDAIAFAKQKVPDVPVIQSMFPSSAVPEAAFDAVVLLDVLEHFEDDGVALRGVATALRPGGIVLITVPAFQFLWTKHDELAHHHRRYRKPELVRALQHAGLTPIFASYYNFFLFPAIVLVRFLTKLLRLERDESDFSRTPGFLNGIFARIFGAERWLLRATSLSWGVSLIAVAKKQ